MTLDKSSTPFTPSKLDDLVKISQGITLSRYLHNSGQEYRVLGLRHLDGLYATDDPDLVRLRDIDKYQVQEDDVLLAIRGTPGKATLVTKAVENCLVDQNLAILRCYGRKPASVMPAYLAVILRSQWFHQQLSSVLSQSTVRSISLSQLRKLEIPLPNLELQKQVIDLFVAMEKFRTASLEALEVRQCLAESTLFALFDNNL
jgi:hypothetical protein